MVSFVVVSKDKRKRGEYVKAFITTHAVDKFDITLLEKDTSDKKTTQSIGIEDVKQLQKKLFLKPIRSKTKVIIIEDAQLLTPEAQNALLKVLEEPPAQTMILLNTTSKEALLPTILSRCQIIELETEPLQLKEKEQAEIQTFIANLPNFSVGEKLKHAEKLAKDKDKAMVWIEKLILVLREETLSVILVSDEGTHPESVQTDSGPYKRTTYCIGSQARMTEYIRSFQSLYTTLKTTNVNPRFAIEHTLLSLN